MKKNLVGVFLFSLFLSFLALRAEAQTALPSPDSLIKGELPTVYYYAADGYRYVFPNNKTFGSWFSDFGAVTTVSKEVLGQIPLKGNVTYRPGVRMVKITTVPKVYVVDKGGQLRWVKSEDLAKKLYGEDWNKKIDDVPDEFFTNYVEGPPIENDTEYNPITVVENTQTINTDRGIKETINVLRSTTQVGSLTEIRELIKDLKNLKKDKISLLPVVPPIILPPSFFPLASSSRPTSTIPAIPAVPATPAIPATSTATSTLSATPAVPAIPAIPPTIITTPPPTTTTITTTSTPSVLKVLSPNGGESWYIGSTYTVTWQNPLQAGFLGDTNYRWLIALKKVNTESEWVREYVPITQSSYIWSNWTFTVPLPADESYYAKVDLFRNCSLSPNAPCPEPSTIISGVTSDLSDNWFYIYTPPLDTYPPTAPTNVTANALSSTQIKISWTASTDNVGVAGYKVYRSGVYSIGTVLGTATSTYYIDSGLTPETSYPYTVQAYDARGNTSGQSNLVSATTFSATQSSSTVTMVTPNGGEQWRVGSIYTIQWSSQNLPAGNNLALELTQGLARIQLVATQLPNNSTSYSWTVPQNIVYNAKYKMRIIYIDSSGVYVANDYSNAEFDILPAISSADTTPPVISLISPAEGVTVAGSNAIIAPGFFDNVGVKKITINLDGAFLASAETSDANLPSNTTLSWNTNNTSNGSHALIAVARDAAGNTTTSTAVNVNVNNAAPSTLVAPTYIRADWSYGWWDIANNNKMNRKIVFQYPTTTANKATRFRLYKKNPGDSSFFLTAEFSNIDSTVCPTNVSAGQWSLSQSSPSCSWVISGSGTDYNFGETSFYVTVADALGNEGAASPIAKLVYLNPLTITTPTESQIFNTLTPTFEWSVPNGTPSTVPNFAIVFDSSNTSNPIWFPSISGGTSKTYNGPALDPAKTYRLSIYGRAVDPGQITDTLIMPSAVINFSVSLSSSTAYNSGAMVRLAAEEVRYQFNETLSRGSIGEAVTRLQVILSRWVDIYPEGLATGYFGVATEAAVKRFQIKYNLPPVGIVGPKTRAILNELTW